MIEKLLLKLRRYDTVSAQEESDFRAAMSGELEFDRGRTIVKAKTEQNRSLLLLDGFIQRHKDLRSGARQILQVSVPGDFIDLHSIGLKRLDHDIASLTQCRLAIFPHDRLQSLIAEHPHLGRMLWLNTLVDAAMHREWMLSLGARSSAARLAHLFCELQVRLDVVGMAQKGNYSLPLTQTVLGETLGITAVHINRMLRALREQGLVTFKNRTVEIADWNRLVRLAEFDPFYLTLDKRPR
jgi:CRP-like cAMP-binding protein